MPATPRWTLKYVSTTPVRCRSAEASLRIPSQAAPSCSNTDKTNAEKREGNGFRDSSLPRSKRDGIATLSAEVKETCTRCEYRNSHDAESTAGQWTKRTLQLVACQAGVENPENVSERIPCGIIGTAP